VPIIAVFNGIIVQMFFEDHGPPHIKGAGKDQRRRNHPWPASRETGQTAKRLGEPSPCRVDRELASCANGRVFVELGALTWPNGFDLDPIALHDRMAEAGELSREAAE
jgi:hypothetical protein